jgi:single-strand DNA-binding protein
VSNDINISIHSGRLGADPKRIGSACNFSIASNSSWKDKESDEWVNKTTWINCVAWGKFGKMIEDVYKKGDHVTIQGSLGENKWEDKTTGEEKVRAVITVAKMDKLGSRAGASRGPVDNGSGSSGEDIDDDDIPF